MSQQKRIKSPFWHRVCIFLLSIVFGVLFYWLLNFILSDIDKIPGPDRNEILLKHVQQSRLDEEASLSRKIKDTDKKIGREKQRQQALKNSTKGLDETIKQLRGDPDLSESEKQILNKSEKKYFENQELDQQYSRTIQGLTDTKINLEEQLETLKADLAPKRDKAHKEYNNLREKHQWKLAFFKLAILIPLFLIGAWLFAKKRSGPYGPIVWAIFIVLFIKIGMVIHDHFPKEYFKYIALLVVIAIIIRILVYMLRLAFAPKKEFLIRQYQQSYDKGVCPICSKPILSGPFPLEKIKKAKYILKDRQGGSDEDSRPYCCPACGTKLYGPCCSCRKIRHLLLPYCTNCGSEQTV